MTSNAHAAPGMNAIAEIMAAAGYPQAAISKVAKVLKNRASSCAPTRTCADTHTPYTDPASGLDEDGRMLDLATPTPPGWVILLIKAALRARGISEDQWGRAWTWFRSWNIDSKGHARIAVRALKGWLRSCRLCDQPRLVAKAPCPTPASEPDLELARVQTPAPASNRAWHRAALERLIGADGYRERVEAARIRFGCGKFAAELAVHGAAVSDGEIER